MKRLDLPLLSIILILTLFGLLMVYDSSSVMAYNIYGDNYAYVKDQLLWMFLGWGVLIFFAIFDYKRFYNLALPLLLVALGMLILVFLPGIGSSAKGASRWVDLGIVRFQPAEFVKLALAIYLAAWFSHKEKGRLLAFSLLLGAVLLLIMLEPDMGTASIVLFEAVMVYFLSGGNMMHFLVGMPIVGILGFILIKIEPYRAARLTGFLEVGGSLENVSYHIKQILIALGSGGLFGLGLGNSLQKYAYLPENVTDSIFPIIAEEFGFIGGVGLILLFVLFVWRGLFIATRAKDTFGKLLAGGIVSFIGIQAVINLGAMTALFPLTGVPLPFISYGGSALIIDMAAIGILFSIAKQSKQ
ncbi:MAG: FtsW/RodA/SpoVE family cell cycle protein [Patescibacteria group bacterium]